MTVTMKRGAIWTTLFVYVFILGGNLLAVGLIVPRLVEDIRTGPQPLDFVGAAVCVLAVFVVGVVINALVLFTRMRIRADDKRVWVPHSLGIREIPRSELTAIRAGRLSSRFAKGVRIFRFLREDGSEAFHVQAAIFPQADLESLARYPTI